MKNKNTHLQYKGYYFVTLTTKDRKDYFGKIEKDKMSLSRRGTIANINWAAISVKFPDVSLDEYIIMPNHIHAIIIFRKVSRSRKAMEEKLNYILDTYKRCTRLDIVAEIKRDKGNTQRGRDV